MLQEPINQNISRNNLFILTSDNAAEYIQHRMERTRFNVVGDSVSVDDAKVAYIAEKTAEVERLLLRPSTVPIKETDLLAKVKQGHAIWAQELIELGVRDLPPVAVVIDENTPASSCGYFCTADQVIHLSPNSHNVSAEVIAHEFGHAGSYQLYVFNPRKILIPFISGMKRQNIKNDRSDNSLLEELACMSFPLNAAARKGIKLSSGHCNIRIDLASATKKGDPGTMLMIKMLRTVFQPNLRIVRDLSENYIGAKLEDAFEEKKSEVSFDLPCYNLNPVLGGVGSAYELACYNLDLIAKECLSQNNDNPDPMIVRQALIRGLLEGFPFHFYRLMSSEYGRDSLTLFYSLGDCFASHNNDASRINRDQVFFSIFANASRLPITACQYVRKQIINYYNSFARNQNIEDCYDRMNS